ncbi:hypothetical protein GOBAR_DD07515 [Gossypium barbadense]|nr:hypothetical protein GOBAR_DD07515 [Gossypium barbadense]
MKDDDTLPTTTATANLKKESSDSCLFGRGRYKFWAFAAILLLHFGLCSPEPLLSVGPPEMEEREKVVKHMWDVYTNSRRIRLPRFWQEAFEAAYEELTSDVPGVREAAVTEIAKMSVQYVDLDPPPIQSTVRI